MWAPTSGDTRNKQRVRFIRNAKAINQGYSFATLGVNFLLKFYYLKVFDWSE